MNSIESTIPHGCFLPLSGFAVPAQGTAHFCLNSTLVTGPEISEHTNERKQIHQALLRNEWPKSCSKCFNKEAKGMLSRRQRVWQRKMKIYGGEKAEAMVREQEEPRIRHLEISFSNICNLSCAMCSSEYSSGWFGPDARAIVEGLDFRAFTKPHQQISRISPHLLEEIFAKIEEIDLIIIKGGEPTRDPDCLKFLQRLAHSRKTPPPVYIQTNGTRHPKDWTKGLDGLFLNAGVSFDGWGTTNDWIRGSSFSKVLTHLEAMAELDLIHSLSVDFTLTAFNVFHLPVFLKEAVKLRHKIRKLTSCPVFQWAQHAPASPVNLKLSDRLNVLEQINPILEENRDFFRNAENFRQVLSRPQAGMDSIEQCKKWLNYMTRLRGFSLEDHERVVASLSL